MDNTDGPRIVFFGTSDFAVTMLDHLKEAGLLPALIVTQPDKPQGRKMILTPPPVKVWADENNIPTIQPENLKSTPAELEGAWDLFIVVAYGNIIPQSILDIPERGALNVHPSLLPKLRGPSPIQSAILEDMNETGVTIMLLDAEMDHGPIVAQARVTPEDWPLRASVLSDMLASIAGDLLSETVIPWINGDIMEEEQDHESATYCKLIKKTDAEIQLDDDPYQNLLKIKAYDVWPQAFYFEQDDDTEIRVKITDAHIEDGKLVIDTVIPEGKPEMAYADFIRNKK